MYCFLKWPPWSPMRILCLLVSTTIATSRSILKPSYSMSDNFCDITILALPTLRA
ncbi:hypothetical protein ASPCADRAFT_205854 [Aspergillus carbonarius ITEM 5010]|uniref:Uncharacterized protein n=1 Tax=Aspergillus carbonarius (strain ITEM 5010) TaxID=602072 RepID=A0A1R3RRD1_ASPC5|nr:hypothetical protein ASPCADRAFT_205854 [Aspergillus carbonarius ITEM 5010]